MSVRQACRCNQHIVRPNHLAAHFKIGPNAGMNAGLCQIKRLNKNCGKNLFDVLLASQSSGGILGTLNAMEKLRSRNCSD